MHYSLNQITYPTPELSQFIDNYCITEDHGNFKGTTIRIVNDGSTALVLNLKSRLVCNVPSRGQTWDYRGFICGQMTNPLYITTTGHTCVLTVKFKPGGIYSIFGIPQNLLRAQYVRLEDIDPVWHRSLAQQMADKDFCCTGLARVVETHLLEKLRKQKEKVLRSIQGIVTICSTQGMVNIGSLARQCQFSQRALDRIFNNEVGIPPKRYADIVKFYHIYSIIKKGPVNWFDLVAKFEFTDQAHLIAFFKRVTGTTPLELLRSLEPGVQYYDLVTMVPKYTVPN